ncbi:hypothetical protein WICMUC_002026 [Wickerhamomyces mucosus]|uniref:GTPase-activating protein GYP5 n=1 Tax=Wickerhamomyces mucosus TaxID=1378264 RepID=A0A9P8PRS5_9ASCO|nr:hypothetical protein WICMUC_002026 [Wickerhamomyces mucosus]
MSEGIPNDEHDSFQDAQEDIQSNASQLEVEQPQTDNVLSNSPSKSKKKKNKKKNRKINDISGNTTASSSQISLNEYGIQDVKPHKEVQAEENKPNEGPSIEAKEDQIEPIESPALHQEDNFVATLVEEEFVHDQVEDEEAIKSKVPDSPISESTQQVTQDDEVLKEHEILESELDNLKLELGDIKYELPPAENETAEAVNETLYRSTDEKIKVEEPVQHLQSTIPPELPSRDVIAPPLLPSRNHVVSPVNSLISEAKTPPQLPTRDLNSKPTTQIYLESTAEEIPKRERSISNNFKPPPLPPQLTASQKAHHRSAAPSGIQSWFQRGSLSSSSRGSISENSTIEYDENYDLLQSRLTENNEDFLKRDEVSREQLYSSRNTLRSDFVRKVSQIEIIDTDGKSAVELQDETFNSELQEIDWPFWTQVVNDHSSVVKSNPAKLAKQLSGGIPSQIRGIVWQLIANSNPEEFSSRYEELLKEESKFEKNILKDLSRTSFIANHNISKDSLYRVIKAYSVLDSEVGYTQGMAFVTVPLLLNMTELESFALLYRLMYGYNIRSLYQPEMPGLVLKLYQFDRLVEDHLPKVHTHFERQGVHSSMFASQWFLTFFAYKFPLEFVLRIFDIVITEGFESLLKFAIVLLQKNEDRLLTLKFDDLIDFLKDQLFNAYLITPILEDDEDEDDEPNISGISNIFKAKKVTPITVDSYDVDQLVEDATNFKLPPITLQRYEEEFSEIHRLEKERREEIEENRLRNNQLRKEVRKLEASYTILNREHIQIANEMISGRVKIATLEDELKDLKQQNINLRERVKSLQTPSGEDIPVPTDLEQDLKRTMERNLEVMTKNQELEDQVSELLKELDELKAERELASQTPETTSPLEKHHSGGWGKKFFRGSV